jgi:hypothetical protein
MSAMFASSMGLSLGFHVFGEYHEKRPKRVLRSGASKKRPRRAKISFRAMRRSSFESSLRSVARRTRLAESGMIKSLFGDIVRFKAFYESDVCPFDIVKLGIPCVGLVPGELAEPGRQVGGTEIASSPGENLVTSYPQIILCESCKVVWRKQPTVRIGK